MQKNTHLLDISSHDGELYTFESCNFANSMLPVEKRKYFGKTQDCKDPN